MMRDKQLDIYRALTMIYIVCVIHTICWNSLFDDVLQSLLLFEMPVIFFIAGASQYVSNRNYGIIETIKNRTKRILLPYYVFLISIIIFYYTVATFTDHVGKFQFSYHALSVRDIIKMIMTGGCDRIPYLGYTWFISTYFIISCLFPIQKRIINIIRPKTYLFIWAIICFIQQFVHIPIMENEIKSMPIYNFFFLTGFLLYKRYNHKIITSIVLSVISVLLFITGEAIPMQNHKYPADGVFLIYGCTMIAILSIILAHIRIKENIITIIWNERGYTIYLYQAIPFFIIYSVCYKWKETAEDLYVFIVYFILTFILNTCLCKFTFRLENIFKSFILNRNKDG